MGKSLESLLCDISEVEGDSTSNSQSKLVKCPKCGTKTSVPWYEHETTCYNCKTITEPNNEIIVNGWYHTQRNLTIIRKKVDNIIPAVHDTDSTRFNGKIDDRT